jgi:acyl-CoA reductase-like NAD-dependent aldehyde dehydrogenase
MVINVRNPRTGLIDHEIKCLAKDEINALAADLRAHQISWQSETIDGRCNALLRWIDALVENKDNIIAALVEDTGRYNESVLEFELLPSSIRRWVTWAKDFFSLPKSRPSQTTHINIEQENVPYPLVAVISPWNFPLLLSTIDVIPALLAGCAIIVKPSEITPRFIKQIQKTIDLVPQLKEVFQYVEGDGMTGSYLIEVADLICFTGSVATGRMVYQKSAELFKPCFLELGGKDAAIILQGANLENAAKSILWGSCVNSGHSCLSIERVYVHSSILDEFIQLLCKEAKSIKMAYGDPRMGHIGPIISDRQVKIIDDHLKDALSKGAKLIEGTDSCTLVNGGYYCRPTILTQVDHTMKIMTEETFGPIMPIMTFESTSEAIHLANDSIFGLSGAVFAHTNEEAIAVGKQLTAGAISINECALTATVHDGEKNAFKMSGLGGSRMGPASLQRFMRRKAYLINQNPNASPWWFRAI